MNRALRILFFCSLVAVTGAAAPTFSTDTVRELARARAVQPYHEPPVTVPAWLRGYTYDQHRTIRFNEKQTVWLAEQLPFRLQFFHPGWLQNQTVQIHEVGPDGVRLIPFSTSLFTYGTAPGGNVPADMGFAGFRLNALLNQPDKFDELVAFLGASYFRALGAGQHYGLSARGLALNSGGPAPEEFPRFTDFWIVRPQTGASSITVHALLDGPSVSGAYTFTITPGERTIMDVHAALIFRRAPGAVGFAPLTSMFQHGENTGWSKNDFRPEVHDSDGLLMNTGTGEWIWRPLTNPVQIRTSAFADKSPRGFGLLQRDRNFEHYDDPVANYHLRPSAWVEPVGDWGEGSVRLVELPTPDETNDNIVAFWVPTNPPVPGQELNFNYRLEWSGENGSRPPRGYVVATRSGAVLDHPDRRRFVLDFARLDFAGDPAQMDAVVTVAPGATVVAEAYVSRVGPTGLWRVAFELTPDGSHRPVELRCFLRHEQNVLTETWSHLWNP